MTPYRDKISAISHRSLVRNISCGVPPGISRPSGISAIKSPPTTCVILHITENNRELNTDCISYSIPLKKNPENL